MRSRALGLALALPLLCLALGCDRTDPTPQASAAMSPAVSLAPELVMPVKGGSPGNLGALGPAPRPLEKFDAAEVFVPPGKSTLHIAWELPPGTGINDEAPFHVRWTTSVGLSEVPPEAKSKGADVHTGFDITVAPLPGEPAAQLAGLVNVVVCDVETHKVCLPVQRRIEVTFAVQKGGKQKVFAEVPLPAARPQG